MVNADQNACFMCHGSGVLPKLTPEESATRDAPIDEIGEATVRKILRGIPQDPDAPGPRRSSLATRSDAAELHDFLLTSIGHMLGEMTLAKLKAMGVDLAKPRP